MDSHIHSAALVSEVPEVGDEGGTERLVCRTQERRQKSSPKPVPERDPPRRPTPHLLPSGEPVVNPAIMDLKTTF